MREVLRISCNGRLNPFQISGKLSKSQIQKAYGVLSELQTLIKDNKPHQFLVDACNRFYTLIPHSFGVDEVPIIRDEETVKVNV